MRVQLHALLALAATGACAPLLNDAQSAESGADVRDLEARDDLGFDGADIKGFVLAEVVHCGDLEVGTPFTSTATELSVTSRLPAVTPKIGIPARGMDCADGVCGNLGASLPHPTTTTKTKVKGRCTRTPKPTTTTATIPECPEEPIFSILARDDDCADGVCGGIFASDVATTLTTHTGTPLCTPKSKTTATITSKPIITSAPAALSECPEAGIFTILFGRDDDGCPDGVCGGLISTAAPRPLTLQTGTVLCTPKSKPTPLTTSTPKANLTTSTLPECSEEPTASLQARQWDCPDGVCGILAAEILTTTAPCRPKTTTAPITTPPPTATSTTIHDCAQVPSTSLPILPRDDNCFLGICGQALFIQGPDGIACTTTIKGTTTVSTSTSASTTSTSTSTTLPKVSCRPRPAPLNSRQDQNNGTYGGVSLVALPFCDEIASVRPISSSLVSTATSCTESTLQTIVSQSSTISMAISAYGAVTSASGSVLSKSGSAAPLSTTPMSALPSYGGSVVSALAPSNPSSVGGYASGVTSVVGQVVSSVTSQIGVSRETPSAAKSAGY